jgi:hypothetical protein
MLLAGCAATRHVPTAAEVCDAKRSDHWEELQAPPAQAVEMMSVRSGERSIGALLNLVPDARAEVWFKSNAGVYRYCRYVPKISYCLAQATTVDFSHNYGIWQTEGPLETICLDYIDRTPSR